MLFFATEVERRSGGTVKVEPLDDEQADVDNDNRVASGEIDAAITQARSWDALDVTSLQALQTPFLVTNEAAAAAATDGELAERLMSGLPSQGGRRPRPVGDRLPASRVVRGAVPVARRLQGRQDPDRRLDGHGRGHGRTGRRGRPTRG